MPPNRSCCAKASSDQCVASIRARAVGTLSLEFRVDASRGVVLRAIVLHDTANVPEETLEARAVEHVALTDKLSAERCP